MTDEFTFGIEEEYFLVDALTKRAAHDVPRAFFEAAKTATDNRTATEFLQPQVEVISSPHRHMADARAELRYLRQTVAAVAAAVVRASSVVENLNSRLRSYFFLRREVGPDYLALLQFFLNHRRFVRSARPERVGKSPAELLRGQAHAHWLELLGYQRFVRPGRQAA